MAKKEKKEKRPPAAAKPVIVEDKKPLTEEEKKKLEKELNDCELNIIKHINDQFLAYGYIKKKEEILKQLGRG